MGGTSVGVACGGYKCGGSMCTGVGVACAQVWGVQVWGIACVGTFAPDSCHHAVLQHYTVRTRQLSNLHNLYCTTTCTNHYMLATH